MSSSAIIPPAYYASQLTPEGTIVAVICALIASAISVLFLKNRRLPPINSEGMIGTTQIFVKGKGAPEFLYANMKKLGLVYRLRLPETIPWIVVCDPALAHKILSTEHEKPNIYRRTERFTNGTKTVFSMRTDDAAWHHARKGMTPAFSTANICTYLPVMYAKIGQFKAILTERELTGTTFDIGPMMAEMAMDLLYASMYKRFQLLQCCRISIQDVSIRNRTPLMFISCNPPSLQQYSPSTTELRHQAPQRVAF